MNNIQSNRLSAASAASALNVLAGIWILIAPFVLGFSSLQAAVWNAVIVGIPMIVFAIARTVAPAFNVWASWFNLGLGIFFLIAPFVLGYATVPAVRWNAVAVGIVVILLALFSLYETSQSRSWTRRPTGARP